jgi:hypothetical protein
MKQNGHRKARGDGENCKIRRFIIFLLPRDYCIDQLKNRRMSGVNIALARNKKFTMTLVENLKGRRKWCFVFFAEFYSQKICIILFSSACLHMAGIFQTFRSNTSERFLVYYVIQLGIQAIRLHLENTADGCL